MPHAARFALLTSLLLAIAAPLAAQPSAPQDSTLDNLQHDAGYVSAPLGSLGAVVERGTGRVPLVLVSGFGLGAPVFEEFMRRNASRYRMFAVTLPGFEGTAAPPMPAPGTSYGDQTWTRAATEAVVRLIRDKKLDRPVMVGHFVNGTQIAMNVAHASDGWQTLDGLETPLLVVMPRFDAAQRADSTRNYLQGYFEEPWRGRLEGRAITSALPLDNAGILVMDDQPESVDREVAQFVKRLGR